MLMAARAARAGDGALDVAKAGVHPFEFRGGGASTAGDDCPVFHARLSNGGEARKTVARHAAARLDARGGIGLDLRAREAGNAPQLRIERLVLTRLDGVEHMPSTQEARARYSRKRCVSSWD